MIDLRKNLNLKFKQEKSGKWYIVLPEWPGAKADLEMVAGADDLLTKEAKGADTVVLTICLSKKSGYKHLMKIANTPLIGGAIYFIGLKPVWLCKVTKTVFGGKLPKDIYFKAL